MYMPSGGLALFTLLLCYNSGFQVFTFAKNIVLKYNILYLQTANTIANNSLGGGKHMQEVDILSSSNLGHSSF